jgi:hypothetical protein
MTVVTQSAVTVIADVLAGHEPFLQEILEREQPGSSTLLPFQQLETVHFARFFVLPSATDLDGRVFPPRLVFLADVDGPAAAFLSALASIASHGLDALYRHCRDYQGESGLLAFLHAKSVESVAMYVNTIGRTAQQIRHEAQLHDAIANVLDQRPEQWQHNTPRDVRAAIQVFVENEPALAWARQTLQPDPAFTLREKLHFGLTVAAGLVLLPVILPALPVWLYFLRQHEKSDVAHDVQPSDGWIAALAAQEDHGVQNPFTSGGFLKPGPFRRFTGNLILWGTNFLARHIFNHADLIGVKTIHFARWIFLDHKRRVVFATNYDGSLENYMDDFVDKIAWALNTSFSHGIDYPRTNWLIKDGANNEQVFKRFNLNHQLVAPFWYAAYQGLTALEIDNNAEIRAGLFGALDDAAIGAWLRRL